MNASRAIEKLFPVFVVCVGFVVLIMAANPPGDPESGMALNRFAGVIVQENGRLMPLDTWARTKLMQLSHRQFTDKEWTEGREERKARITATQWAIETMLFVPMIRQMQQQQENGEKVDLPQYYVFRIDNDQLLLDMNLKPSKEHGLLFAIGDFVKNPVFEKEERRIIGNGGPEKGNLRDERFAELISKKQAFLSIVGNGNPRLVPPVIEDGDSPRDLTWDPLADADPRSPLYKPLFEMLTAYTAAGQANKFDKARRVADFNKALDEYFVEVEKIAPGAAGRGRLEVVFNNFAPYYQCTILFCGVLLLALASWLVQFLGQSVGSTTDVSESTWPQTIRKSAVLLAAVAMVVYTAALISRILISGYAPVTNLYSSAIFIGWGCALLCLGLEYILKNGIGVLVASVTGLAALIVAHNLLDGDSMVEVVAVLRSNFWLSTHVICITLGYTATFVAGFLGICYVMLGLYTPLLRRDHVLFSKVIYGVVCFAMFLSFVGTVLGGIWADQSWGRFWGWDPKENGALLIVIWNAVILHARWGGMVKSRGVALLAIFGNIVTAWSWFGTNLLGVGLHSYGFMKGAMFTLLIFAASQLIIIAIGALTPQKTWTSFRQFQAT